MLHFLKLLCHYNIACKERQIMHINFSGVRNYNMGDDDFASVYLSSRHVRTYTQVISAGKKTLCT